MDSTVRDGRFVSWSDQMKILGNLGEDFVDFVEKPMERNPMVGRC